MSNQDQHIWYACNEHLDYVMDDVIDEYHTAPTLEPLEHTKSGVCKWCGQPAEYQLELEYGISEQML